MNRLHICQTCMRDGARASDGLTLGQHLTRAVVELQKQSDLSDSLIIRKVPCLSGCPNPCNVAFRAPEKTSLRFSQLSADDAEDLITFARQYMNSDSGDIPDIELPDSLRERLTARTPPPPLAIR